MRPAGGFTKAGWQPQTAGKITGRAAGSLPGLCVAAAGIAMMIYGISRGEINVVFEKAVRICMECIGIG